MPPVTDMKNAGTPLVKSTNTDLSRHIEKLMPTFNSVIENITGMFENPGFTPRGKGIRLSAAEIPAERARSIPEYAAL